MPRGSMLIDLTSPGLDLDVLRRAVAELLVGQREPMLARGAASGGSARSSRGFGRRPTPGGRSARRPRPSPRTRECRAFRSCRRRPGRSSGLRRPTVRNVRMRRPAGTSIRSGVSPTGFRSSSTLMPGGCVWTTRRPRPAGIGASAASRLGGGVGAGDEVVAGASSCAPSSPETAVRPGRYVRPTRHRDDGDANGDRRELPGEGAGLIRGRTPAPEAERAEPSSGTRSAGGSACGDLRGVKPEGGSALTFTCAVGWRGLLNRGGGGERSWTRRRWCRRFAVRAPSALGYSGWGIGPTGVGTKEGIGGRRAPAVSAAALASARAAERGPAVRTAPRAAAKPASRWGSPDARAPVAATGGGGSFGPAEDERSLSFLARADFCC